MLKLLHEVETTREWPTNASTTLVVASLDTMVGVALGSCCGRVEGTAQRHLGRLFQVFRRRGKGRMGGRCWKWKRWTLREDRTAKEPLHWWWTQRRHVGRSNDMWYGSGPFIRTLQKECSGCSVATSLMNEWCCSKTTFSERAVTITAILPWSKWSVLMLRIVWQDDMRYVFFVSLDLRIRVSVDDMEPLPERDVL